MEREFSIYSMYVCVRILLLIYREMNKLPLKTYVEDQFSQR